MVELKFFPDYPIETFEAPRWGLGTYGQRHHAAIQARSPFGPLVVDEVEPPTMPRSQTA